MVICGYELRIYSESAAEVGLRVGQWERTRFYELCVHTKPMGADMDAFVETLDYVGLGPGWAVNGVLPTVARRPD